MKKLMLVVALLIMAVGLSAQEVVEYGPDVFIDIDGIQIGDYPTREELNSHFGIPICETYIEADIDNYFLIEYDGVSVELDENGKMIGFKLTSSGYPMMTLYQDEGIRIGETLNYFLSKGFPICYVYELEGEGEKKIFCFSVKRKDFVPDYITSFTLVQYYRYLNRYLPFLS